MPAKTTDQNIYSALASALGDIPTISKDRTANVPTKGGGSYSYSYADLATIMETVRPILAKHGLALVQSPTTRYDEAAGTFMVGISTVIYHSSGEQIAGHLDLPCPGRTDRDGVVHQPGPQDIGSAITYGRRYALAMLGVVTEDDDDGAQAQRGSQASRSSHGQQRRPSDRPITEKQLGRVWAILGKKSGNDREVAKTILRAACGAVGYSTDNSLKNLPMSLYDGLVESIEGWDPDLASQDPADRGGAGAASAAPVPAGGTTDGTGGPSAGDPIRDQEPPEDYDDPF
jgi:hypothetical protein